jgi:hypothetical protein
MPVVLATQEAETRGPWFKASPGNSLRLSEKIHLKKRVVEWLKV